jgi:hypothetical protein
VGVEGCVDLFEGGAGCTVERGVYLVFGVQREREGNRTYVFIKFTQVLKFGWRVMKSDPSRAQIIQIR